MKKQLEYDLYLPLSNATGPIEANVIGRVKSELVDQFGGVTDFRHKNEGLWRVSGVTYRDEILILRVLTDSDAGSDRYFVALKERLRSDLRQEDVLIVQRVVHTI